MSPDGKPHRQPDQIPFSLSQWAGEVLENATARAVSRGLDLDSDIDPSIPDRLIGDPSRLKEVMAGLLDNAIRCTDRGNVHLKIEQASVPSPDTSEVEFSVSDSGQEIPKEVLVGIFKGGAQTGPRPGLPTTKALVETMGGVIWAESLSGRGNSFHFRMVFRRVG